MFSINCVMWVLDGVSDSSQATFKFFVLSIRPSVQCSVLCFMVTWWCHFMVDIQNVCQFPVLTFKCTVNNKYNICAMFSWLIFGPCICGYRYTPSSHSVATEHCLVAIMWLLKPLALPTMHCTSLSVSLRHWPCWPPKGHRIQNETCEEQCTHRAVFLDLVSIATCAWVMRHSAACKRKARWASRRASSCCILRWLSVGLAPPPQKKKIPHCLYKCRHSFPVVRSSLPFPTALLSREK